jgi:hypothetical protein
MGKHYLPGLRPLVYSFSDDHVLISSVSVDIEQPENEDSSPSLSQSSPSSAASEDPSDNHLNDIFSRLL